MKKENEDKWIIFKVRSNVCGVSADYVREMIALPDVRPVPEAAEFIKGVINLRGNVYKVLDMRLLMGMQSFEEEYTALSNTLQERKQDHINWLNELEASVTENREFALTTDPHACKFGKWYDHFKADNLTIHDLLTEFDTPHKAIHAIGIKATQLVKSGNHNEALELIKHTKNNELKKMIELFDNLSMKISLLRREIGIVIEADGKSAIITTDAILTVEDLTEDVKENINDVGVQATADYFTSIAKYNSKGDLALLIDAVKVLAHT